MDIIADALTRIRNAAKLNKTEVTLRKSKTVRAIADILQREGFLNNVTENDSEVVVELAFNGKTPLITGVKRISKSGQRKYVNHSEVRPVLSGRGIGILTTSKGVMTTEDAKHQRIGGEYICEIW